MAYNGGYEGQGRPYAGPAAQRPAPQRQYPPGPGGPGPQQYNGPPQQYGQYQEDYGYEYDDYGNGYDQGYGGQYDDMNYQRGPPNGGNYPPQQDYYGPGPGPGRGGRPPMPGGRGGPPGPGQLQRAPTGDGPRGGPYPPRGGLPAGPGRGFPPPGRGGRPGPLERSGNSDPSSNRRPMNGPISPSEPGFGGSPFPAFPGHQRKTDLEEETQIVSRMEGMDINQGPGPRGPPARGPMGPPPPRGGPQYPEQRRGPPGPGYGGYQDDGFGPPERSMTMPARDPMEMRQAPPPHRSETAPYNPSRGMPGRPNTAQGMRGQPPQRGYPPNDGYTEPGYDNPRAPQQRPASFDDFYDYYDSGNGGSNYPPQNPPSASSEVPPNFDAMGPQPGGRNSFDQHMEAAPGPREFGGPGRLPELNRTKSQPDLRSSQTAVFEMAGDVPPIPNEYQGQPGPGFQGGLPSGPNARRMSPPGGLPTGPAPYRPGAQPQGGPNPDSLPSHPTPVRPGLMPNSVVNLSNKPPPVRNYGNTQPQQNMMPQQQQQQQQQGPPPPASQMTGHGAAPAKPVEAPVTIQELEHLRAVVKADATDQASALRLAKRLVEAADVLVPNLPDPKSRGRARERYLLDAQKILKKLASASNPDAMFFLADSLGRGLFSGEPDNKEAFTLYQSSAKLGHAAAAYRTAVCCEIGNEEGGGTRKDPLKAIQWYKRAATLGDTPAMYKVGMILLKGLLGQPRNPREAVGWLKRAAERADTENPHALHELGLLYESAQPNDAILRDEPYAFTLFKKAAELGYKFSQFRLGCAYEYGLMGCPIDPRLSIMWYSRAATQEEHQSELALSGWYLTGSDGVLSQSDTEAYLWARKAAVAGLAKAEYAMGYFTEVGIGVPANLEDAKRWYWRAAAQDFPKARERLEDLKRSGKNGPRARERISRSKIGKQQEGECSVM